MVHSFNSKMSNNKNEAVKEFRMWRNAYAKQKEDEEKPIKI